MRERQTDRQTETETETDPDRQTQTEIQTDKQGQRETKRYVRFCCLGKKKRDIHGHAGIWTDE